MTTDNGGYLGEVARMLAETHLELDQKGYSEPIIEGALKRSVNQATKLVESFPEDIHDQAFMELLRKDLDHAETWAKGVQSQGSADEIAAPEGNTAAD